MPPLDPVIQSLYAADQAHLFQACVAGLVAAFAAVWLWLLH